MQKVMNYVNLNVAEPLTLKSLAAMVRQLDKLDPQSKAMVQELITGLFGSWLELLPLPELDKKRFLP